MAFTKGTSGQALDELSISIPAVLLERLPMIAPNFPKQFDLAAAQANLDRLNAFIAALDECKRNSARDHRTRRERSGTQAPDLGVRGDSAKPYPLPVEHRDDVGRRGLIDPERTRRRSEVTSIAGSMRVGRVT